MADENVQVESEQDGVAEAGNAPPDLGAGDGRVSSEPPKNYLVMAILVTIFCCWPLGIPAIVFAAQVNGKFAKGDYEGAEKASQNAKFWSLIALVAGLVVVGAYLLLMTLGLVAGVGAGNVG